MNALTLLTEKKELNLDQEAIFVLGTNAKISFRELLLLAAKIQKEFHQKYKLKAGDTVLLADQISPTLYASVIAILGMGATVILVEPFLPLTEIEEVVNSVNPTLFLASRMGQCWGLRVKAIRKIKHWVHMSSLLKTSGQKEFEVERVNPNQAGIITFSSGTTGKSKGIVRTHSALFAQNRIIEKEANLEQFKNPDLTIFANLVLGNLAMGRGSVFIPPPTKNSLWGKSLLLLNSLPATLQPETLSCGPAFLKSAIALKNLDLSSLKSIHVGGALSDCSIFTDAFSKLSDARFLHVYGSTEAEPVAFSDARIAVKESLKRGYFQTLLLGKPIPEITPYFNDQGLWVKGPHVAPFYLGNEQENSLHKKRDSQGDILHFMGDRIKADELGWWYEGRAFQQSEDFNLEQEIYSQLQSSKSFIHRGENNEIILMGEFNKEQMLKLKQKFPIISEIRNKKIIRDRRHRARIDRKKTRESRVF